MSILLEGLETSWERTLSAVEYYLHPSVGSIGTTSIFGHAKFQKPHAMVRTFEFAFGALVLYVKSSEKPAQVPFAACLVIFARAVFS